QGAHFHRLVEVTAQAGEPGLDVLVHGRGDFDFLPAGLYAHRTLLRLAWVGYCMARKRSGAANIWLKNRPDRGSSCQAYAILGGGDVRVLEVLLRGAAAHRDAASTERQGKARVEQQLTGVLGILLAPDQGLDSGAPDHAAA